MTDKPLPTDPAERAALEANPSLIRYLEDPVKRFVAPDKPETLPIEGEPPAAVEVITQPGVVAALQDILNDLDAPPTAEDDE